MISLIIPFKNESASLARLIPQLQTSLDELGVPYEVHLVSNGSTDDWEQLLVAPSPAFTFHKLRRGDKGRALRRGLDKSTGDIILFMDADLEDDPRDIPLFYQTIMRGYDFVNGWRKYRRHEWHRVLPSFIGNTLILRKLLGSTFHDINCGFKMFRRECLHDVVLYGDNFRFLPLVVERLGFKTIEVVVRYKNRLYGRTKYGFFNRLTVFADILTSYFIFRFAQKPLHFFAPIGMTFFIPGMVITIWLGIERMFTDVLLKDRPLLLAGILLIVVGLQIVMTGVIGELIVYTSKKLEKEIEEE
jgi:glycosyltransferase involved in cell wall biosynthesis